jgi:hypothetical protein
MSVGTGVNVFNEMSVCPYTLNYYLSVLIYYYLRRTRGHVNNLFSFRGIKNVTLE